MIRLQSVQAGSTMVYLMLSDGSRRDVADADSVGVEDDCVVCRDGAGGIVETFDKLAVTAFSTSASKMAQFFAASTPRPDSTAERI
jgi:hypothetical protein